MRSSGIPQDRLCARLMFCLALSLCSGITGAAERRNPQNGSEPIEEIEVTGRSLQALRIEIENAETRMYDLFNQFNDERQFNISCEAVRPTGSRITQRECVPVYMKRERMTSAQNFLLYDLTPRIPGSKPEGGWSLAAKGAPENSGQVWIRNLPKHKAFNTRFRELAAEHPELAEASAELREKRARLRELEERRRERSTLGRIFAAFAGKSDN